VSPTLKILFAEGKGTLSGTVSVPKAIMTLQELPENAVTTSPDEVILGEAKVPETAAVETHIDTDIAVELGKQVRFSGQGLDTYLQGHLRIVTSDGKIAMNGNVDLNKATYKRFGQDLTVRKGRFLFNGPVDNPWLDVEAIRLSKSKQVTAVLSLSGTLQKPKTLISSEPSLPEADALAYLITGGSLSQVSKSQGDRVASAALSYGAGQVSWVAGKLGIDELALEEGETLQDTLVTVGQYLTPDFYVGTKVGLFNKQAVLVLKHKLTDKINLETQTGTSKRVKLNYEFDTN
jgi:translocation and assembly module TamB